MCLMIFERVEGGDEELLGELRRVLREDNYTPSSYKDIVNKILVTAFLSTANSSEESTQRAAQVAKQFNTLHFNLSIDEAYESIKNIFSQAYKGSTPKFDSEGGTKTEDLALQNI